MLFWIKFKDDEEKGYTVQAEDRGAAAQLARIQKPGNIVSIKSLPYPSQPHLGPIEDVNGNAMGDFCWKPHECAGNTACPSVPTCVS